MTDRALPDGTAGAEHLGVRVFSIAAPDQQTLADQIALLLGEHLATNDELHITYNVSQVGWRHDPGRAGLRPRPPHTRLEFEFSALIVLRST